MDILRYKNRESGVPRRGSKENVPDGSERQEKKLSNLCHRNEVLLKEERVAKLGHIAIGEWVPDEGSVEVIVEKGKFWHTMGYHKADKKWLRPFEALYLLETCSLDIRFHGITMSVQEAYEILIPKIVSIEFYQVYSYLMRLGYIIEEYKSKNNQDTLVKDENNSTTQIRDESSKSTKEISSEKVCHQSTGIPGEPKSTCKEICHLNITQTEESDIQSSCERAGSSTEAECEPRKIDTIGQSGSSDKPSSHVVDKVGVPLANMSKRKFDQSVDINARNVLPEKKVKLNYTSWNFKEICLPNIMDQDVESRELPIEHLDKIRLPQMLTLQRESQVLTVTGKEETQPSRLLQDLESDSSDKQKRNMPLVNKDSPRNWYEYKQLKKQNNDLSPLHESPMKHIWEGLVHPLIKPSDALSTELLMDKLQIIKKANIPHCTEFCETSTNGNIHFSVYLPETNYKKSAPGKPIIYVIVTKLEDEPPNMLSQTQLTRQAGTTPLVWAVVDNGDISFYTLHEVDLPQEIFIDGSK
ncbi:tRNA-splicing endonuclease subunit Sen54-like [Antedon mediterranea]|uniref:tRNA-splicing endonuclease subunit Sen54-like n=1 Tax=Antedon mediterranea TaxID=105859 RepID=UPI003AF59081